MVKLYPIPKFIFTRIRLKLWNKGTRFEIEISILWSIVAFKWAIRTKFKSTIKKNYSYLRIFLGHIVVTLKFRRVSLCCLFGNQSLTFSVRSITSKCGNQEGWIEHKKHNIKEDNHKIINFWNQAKIRDSVTLNYDF